MGWTDGGLPFWALPSLGGRNTLRGYIENRFTGQAFWHASAEYRFWIVPRGFSVTDTMRVERLGAALFYDIGTVSNGLSGLWSETVHDSYGIGFRFSLERTAQFRADLGFSKEGTNFSFGYGQSF
jgi:hemolysin activation/secretion protein